LSALTRHQSPPTLSSSPRCRKQRDLNKSRNPCLATRKFAKKGHDAGTVGPRSADLAVSPWREGLSPINTVGRFDTVEEAQVATDKMWASL